MGINWEIMKSPVAWGIVLAAAILYIKVVAPKIDASQGGDS